MQEPEPEEAWRLPDQDEPDPGSRRVKPAHAVLGSLLALVLLCCGGTAVFRAFTGSSPDATSTWQQPSTEPTVTAAPVAPLPTVAVKTVSASPSKSKKKSKRPSTKPTTSKPTTVAPTTAPTTTAPTGPIVRAGAFCSPVGALGVTATGKLMRCTRREGEDRARWRAV